MAVRAELKAVSAKAKEKGKAHTFVYWIVQYINDFFPAAQIFYLLCWEEEEGTVSIHSDTELLQ